MTVLLAVAAYAVILTFSWIIIGWINSLLIRWANFPDECRTCHLLEYIPGHPPYWMLRWHLRRISQHADADTRETIQ